MNIIRVILIVTLLFLSKVTIACVCFETTKASFLEQFSSADLVVYGKAIGPAYSDDYLLGFYTTKGGATTVIYEIDSVLKGDLKKGDRILIYQNSGSCDEEFGYEESKLVLGSFIKEFKMMKEEMPGDFIDGVLTDHLNQEDLEYYNLKIKQQKGVWTNQCSVYNLQSDIHDLIRSWLK